MDKKRLARRHIITLLCLFTALFVVTLAVLLGIYYSGKMTVSLEPFELVLISALSAYLPCGAYAGACTCFLKIEELNKKQSVLLVVLFPLILALTLAVGIIMVIPMIIKSIIVLIKG